MRDEEDDLLLSQLTHAGYCLRRVALVMNEQLWSESSDTAKGRLEHERTHTRRIERRSIEVKLYDHEVRSQRLGIRGKCDCIEAQAWEDGCTVPGMCYDDGHHLRCRNRKRRRTEAAKKGCKILRTIWGSGTKFHI